MGIKKYDYRRICAAKSADQGYYIVYETVNETNPLAKCKTREAAELIAVALNK